MFTFNSREDTSNRRTQFKLVYKKHYIQYTHIHVIL